MEGCFEILIPKNVVSDQDLDFDALLRGETSGKNQPTDSYKDVSQLKEGVVDK